MNKFLLLPFLLYFVVASPRRLTQFEYGQNENNQCWKSLESSDTEFITYSNIDIFCDGDDINQCTNKGSSSFSKPGVSVFDCNNDGYDDILFSAATGEDRPKLFINIDGNVFNESAESRGLSNGKISYSALTIDIDNDGWIDVIFSHQTYLLQVFRNTGDCNFVDITLQSVPYISVIASVHATTAPEGLGHGIGGLLAAGDYDQDGDLDIIATSVGFPFPVYAHQHSGTTMLWTNQYNDDGSIVFLPAFYRPILPIGLGFGCAVSFEDFDEDGWDDIILSICNQNALGETVMWKNSPYSVFDENTIGDPFYDSKRIFVDVSNEISPFGVYGSLGLGMTHTFGDFNGDNHFDLFMSDMGTSFDSDGSIFSATYALFLNQYPLSKSAFNTPTRFFLSNFRSDKLVSYDEVAEDIGVDREQTGWSGLMLDLDNDGWDDLVHQGNFLNIGQTNNPGFVYKNVKSDKGNGNINRKVKLMTNLSLGFQETTGMAYGDFNNDGFIDIAINSQPVGALSFAPSPIYIMKNSQLNANNCDENGIVRNYLDIELRGNGNDANYYGINVLIRVYIPSLKYSKIGKIRAGTGWASSNANYAHFGIPIKVDDCGDIDIDYDKYKANIEVFWKGMDENYKESYNDIHLNQRIKLNQNQINSNEKFLSYAF